MTNKIKLKSTITCPDCGFKKEETIETDINGLLIRQIEYYDNDKILKYDINGPYDEYGQLGDKNLDIEEFKEFEISKGALEVAWTNSF